MEVMELEKNVTEDIRWWELGIVALACGGGVISILRFAELNPGWGMMGQWPAAAWISGMAALVCVAAFLGALYRFYFMRKYGRLAPWVLGGFIIFHALGALLVMTRVG